MKRILVVDDEENIRELVKDLLKDDFKVTCVEDGIRGLELLKKRKFDLILLDFFMPGMSGKEVAEEIRKNPKAKNTKIAFLTVASFGKEGHKSLKKLKVLDYIQKPFNNDDFTYRVKKMVD
jgi:CheY-like chemotaxis protein